jgi:hypothetical protein
MTATTTRPLDYEEQLRRESDLRDWKRADLAYQRKVEAGYALDAEEIDDWNYCQAQLVAYWLEHARA